MNYLVNFKMDKNIFVEDVNTREEAISKTSEHLLNLMNQSIIEQTKAQIVEEVTTGCRFKSRCKSELQLDCSEPNDKENCYNFIGFTVVWK